MRTLGEIAAVTAALSLIVSNLTALWLAIKNTGIISVVRERLDDHSRRISSVSSVITQVALQTETNKDENTK
jgi:hypothetical protein